MLFSLFNGKHFVIAIGKIPSFGNFWYEFGISEFKKKAKQCYRDVLT